MNPFRFTTSRLLLTVTILTLAFAYGTSIWRSRAAIARIKDLGGMQLSEYTLSSYLGYGVDDMPRESTLRLPPGKDTWEQKRDRSCIHWGLAPYTLGHGVADEDLRIMDALPDIRFLDLAFTDIGDDGVANLRDLRELEVLLLEHTTITDNAAHSLRKMSTLRVLSMAHTDIGDKGLALLTPLNQLEILNLEGTQITSESLHYLCILKCLKRVDVTGTRVSLDAIGSLKTASPNLTIIKRG